MKAGISRSCVNTWHTHEICDAVSTKNIKYKKSYTCKEMGVLIKHGACGDGISKVILTQLYTLLEGGSFR